MAKREIPMNCAMEYDALTRWRHHLHWRAGERMRVKRRFSKRVRRLAKLRLRLDTD